MTENDSFYKINNLGLEIKIMNLQLKYSFRILGYKPANLTVYSTPLLKMQITYMIWYGNFLFDIMK